MPRVPYLDAPTVTPETVPTPYSEVQASPNAFGAQAGAAEIQSGQQDLAQAQQTNQTAVFLQQQQMDTVARNAQVAASQELAQKLFNYKTLQGQYAVDAMQPAINDMSAMRQAYLAKLPTDYERQAFDNDFARQLSYAIKDVGSWAAYQGNRAEQSSIEAQLGSVTAQMAQRWNDPAERARLVDGNLSNGKKDPNSIVSLASQLAVATGHDPTTPEGRASANALVSHYVSEGITSAAKSAMATGNWQSARQIIDESVNATVPGTDAVGADGTPVPGTGVPMLDTAHHTAIEQTFYMLTNAALADQNRQMLLAERQERMSSEAALNGYIGKMYSDNPGVAGSVTATQVANDPTLRPETKEALINRLQSGPEVLPKVSAQTATQLLGDMRRPPGDPQRMNDTGPIYDAFLNHQLSKSDFDFLKREFAARATPEGERLNQQVADFLKAVKPSIDNSNPLMGKLDPSGSLQFYNFQQDLALAMSKAKDPTSLLDHSSPDYWGSPGRLAAYQTSLSQSVTNVTSRLEQGAAPVQRPPLNHIFGN